MTQPHVIRLRGPWEFETLGDDPQRGIVQAEGDWLAGLTAGQRIRLRRRFQRPTGLSAQTQVTIVVAGVACERVLLNEEALEGVTEGDAVRFDVSTRLRPSNLLTIEVDGERRTMTGQVWLEIVER